MERPDTLCSPVRMTESIGMSRKEPASSCQTLADNKTNGNLLLVTFIILLLVTGIVLLLVAYIVLLLVVLFSRFVLDRSKFRMCTRLH